MLGLSESKLILKILLTVTLLGAWENLRNKYNKSERSHKMLEKTLWWHELPWYVNQVTEDNLTPVGRMILGNLFCPSQIKWKHSFSIEGVIVIMSKLEILNFKQIDFYFCGAWKPERVVDTAKRRTKVLPHGLDLLSHRETR